MTEEDVTKSILKWLIQNGWNIICFDFPQSGTGIFLHPNNSSSKNKDSVNIDIVAVKGGECLFFENKDRFYFQDYKKIYKLKTENNYSRDIGKLLKEYNNISKFYGIGLPTSAHKKKSKASINLVDFIIGVNDDKTIEILFKNDGINFT